MRHDNHSTHSDGRYGLALISAVAVGVALGMLFAPSDGRRLRRQIRDGAERFGRKTADGYRNAAETVSDLMERGRSAVNSGRATFQQARVEDDERAEM